jgi:hypothetical protein
MENFDLGGIANSEHEREDSIWQDMFCMPKEKPVHCAVV